MKKTNELPAIALVFPDVYKGIVNAFMKYMPGEHLDGDVNDAILKAFKFETERLVGTPVKDDLGPILTSKLDGSSKYVTMALSFYDAGCSIEESWRRKANDEFIDVAIEGAVKRFCKKLRLPHSGK